MANKLAIIGLPNALGGSGTAVTAGTTAASGMPLSNLLTEEPSDLCRLETVDPAKTWWRFTVTPPIATGLLSYWPIQGIGLINHNLGNASQYRMVVGVSGQQIVYENMAPTAVAASSGLTGVVGSVDEDPFVPDGVAVTLSTTADYVTFDFNTPAQRVVGTDKHVLIVRAKGEVSGCKFSASLLEGGTARLTLGADQQLGTSYRNYFFSFDPTTVTDLANLQIKIVHGGVPGKLVSIDAVRWIAEVSTATPAADSGWLDAPAPYGDTTFGGTTPNEIGTEPTQSLAHYFASAGSGLEVEIHVRNAQRDAGYADAVVMGTAGYTQAGCAVAGPALQPTYAPALGDMLAVRDPSAIGYTLGGASYGSSRRRRRVAPLQLRALSAAEGWGLFERLDWMAGTRGAVLVCLFPDATDQSKRLGTFWATLEELSALARPAVAGGLLSKAYTFVEKL